MFSEVASGDGLSEFKVFHSLSPLSFLLFPPTPPLQLFLLLFLHCRCMQEVFGRKLPEKFKLMIWLVLCRSDVEQATVLVLSPKLRKLLSAAIPPLHQLLTFLKGP